MYGDTIVLNSVLYTWIPAFAGMTILFYVIPNLIGDLMKCQSVLSMEGYVLQHLNVHEIPAFAGMTYLFVIPDPDPGSREMLKCSQYGRLC